MTLSVELFRACCASVSKITTFASRDPMLGTPAGSASQYLKQQNFSIENLRLYYREALQKGPYMMELAFQESEGIEEGVFAPFMENVEEDQEEVRKRIVLVCRRLYVPDVVEELLADLSDSAVVGTLDEMGTSPAIFQSPDAFLFFLNKITNYNTTDSIFELLVNRGLLFQAIDYQFRSMVISDNRGKALGGFTSFMKMKLRINLVQKQIENKQKQKTQFETAGKTDEAQKAAVELATYQKAMPMMSEYLGDHGNVLEQLHSQINRLHEEVGQAVLEKVSAMALAPVKDKPEVEEGNVGEVVEEVNKLIKQPMEFVGGDRIEFSHNLLGPLLETQKTKVEKAKNLFETIPNTHPKKPILANRLGVILNAMGTPDKAAEYFRRALVLLPGSQSKERAPIESNLFHTLLNKGSFDAALRYMMESLGAGSEECNLFDTERYQPKQILGVGGMGVTFLCQDVYEETQVVIKTLWRYTTGSLKDTFSEAFTAKKINNPHIVRVFNIGRHRANRPFIVMEYCKGVDLGRYLQEVRKGEILDVAEALYIISEVAKGLESFHNQTPPIIHRDIKPNNILYHPETRGIKIIDFGIACMMPGAEEISRAASRSSSSGGVIAKNMAGTWGYMSPEQQRGESVFDPRIDIFSLGKTLMFLLTGKTPPPENIFALGEHARNTVGELVGYCLMPHAPDRYTATQLIAKIEEIQAKSKQKPSARVAKAQPAEPEMMAAPLAETTGFYDEFGDDPQEALMATPADEEEMMAQQDSFSELGPPPVADQTEEIGNPDPFGIGGSSNPISSGLQPEGMAISPDEGMAISPDEATSPESNSWDAAGSFPDQGSPESVAAPGSSGVSYDLPTDLAPVDYSAEETESSTGHAGGIMVQDEAPREGGDSLKSLGGFEKITLPVGYTWEGDLVICEKDGATMIYIPAGAFIMGYDADESVLAERPEHEVILDPFLIDECLVTWYQYNLFCQETERKPPANPGWDVDESQPVVDVTWEDANAYAKWARKNLPLEAQWEKAARGGAYFDGDTTMQQKNLKPRRRYPWGDETPNHGGDWRANCVGEPLYGERSSSPVGTYPDGASPYGCLDMAGNVWEWCEDWFSETYYTSCPPTNPKGPRTGPGRVVRGGAWNSEHKYLSTTFRTYLPADEWWNIVGFRTMLPLKPKM